jgi:hypothetical protein
MIRIKNFLLKTPFKGIYQKPPVSEKFKPAFGGKFGAFDPQGLLKVFFLQLDFGFELGSIDLINPCPHQFPIVRCPRNFLHSELS